MGQRTSGTFWCRKSKSHHHPTQTTPMLSNPSAGGGGASSRSGNPIKGRLGVHVLASALSTPKQTLLRNGARNGGATIIGKPGQDTDTGCKCIRHNENKLISAPQHADCALLRCSPPPWSPLSTYPQGSVTFYHHSRVSSAVCITWARWAKGILYRWKSQERRRGDGCWLKKPSSIAFSKAS